MPTYQYICPHCGHEFEEFQSITERPIESCPHCSRQPRRIISGGAGFIFKGSGFYTTDYRSEAYKKAARSEKGGDSPGKSPSPDKSGSDNKATKAQS